MSYETSILDLRGLSCKEQRAEYERERDRVTALAKTLGPVAEACFKSHSDYKAAVAAKQIYDNCKQAEAVWSARSAEYDAARLCQQYQAAKAEYDRMVAAITAENLSRKRKYEALKADLDAKNKNIAAQNQGAAMSYQQALANWKLANQAFLNRDQIISTMAQALENSWQATYAKNSSWMSKYDWNYRSTVCGSRMRCMTQAKKDSLSAHCAVIKGLGATAASDCLTRSYYPTCPTTCPPYTPNSAMPTEPKPIAFYTYPPEPAYLPTPTLADFLRSKGVAAQPDGCSMAAPNPGLRPACTFAPDPPAQPTCVPPDIPLPPTAPNCKPSLFEQVGPMWLLLAAGAGGLYWYSKKK